jgi:ribonuclease R
MEQKRVKMNQSDKDFLETLRKLLTNPMPMRAILEKLGAPAPARSALRKRIRDLTQDGSIVRLKGACYGLPNKMNLVTGAVQGHPDGFGWVIPDEADEADVFLSQRAFGEAMSGDRVVARVEGSRSDGKREGRVIQILERAHHTIPGVFERARSAGYVVPFDRRITHDILVPPGQSGDALGGQAVMVEITEYPSATRQPVGKIVKVIGDSDDPTVEVAVIAAKLKLRTEFPHAVTHEAKSQRAPSEKDYEGRLDLRKKQIVTIDGETAKDFDDAVDVERVAGGGYRLGVHIADVSHYVQEDSPLDKEAFRRGTSVYFPGSVIPMLPFELSNDLCSLNPKVDRLTLSCVMTFSKNGDMLDAQIHESVIRSAERMTYTAVAGVLKGDDPALLERYSGLIANFRLMEELAEILRRRRIASGAIDFDLPEPQILLDITGRPESIILAERNVAHRLIEEFMLSANKAVAGHFLKRKYPAIYRVHDRPDPEKVKAFGEFAKAFGIHVKPGESLSSARMGEIIEEVRGKPEEKLITRILLRSMKQARYSDENIGHFGLAFAHYTHFTSPIRRYPDLIVHRLLKDLISDKRRDSHWKPILPEIAVHTSKTERTAEEGEREAVKLRQTQYMADKIGEVYDGMISGVTSFGFFVEFVNPPVEGLVRVATLTDDYYIFDERGHALNGDRTRRRFRLGDMVKVKVESVSIERRRVDLSLVDIAPRGRGPGSRAPGGRPGGRPAGGGREKERGGRNASTPARGKMKRKKR